MKRLLYASLAALTIAAISLSAAHAQTYAVTDLGSLPSATWTIPYAINSNGAVAGDSGASPGYGHAFLWTPTAPNSATGTMRDLGLPRNFTYATARSINDSGQVVGWGGGAQVGLLWSGGSIVSLPALSGSGATVAYAINKSGDVVGASQRTTPTNNGMETFLWKPSSPNGAKGKMYDTGLPGIGGGGGLPPYGLNAYGQIANAGWSFIWTPTVANGTSGSAVSAPWLESAAINDSGQTTGYAPGSPYTNINGTYSSSVAAFWDPTHGLQVLGFPTNTVLPAGDFWTGSYSVGINNSATIVGGAGWEGFAVRGGSTVWIWTAATGMLDLNVNASIQASGWVLQTPYAINDKGQIVGTGTFNGQTRAFLLTPH